ncbi:MAG: ATP-dependent RecD-like DNA helicase [Chroococcidiopsidaceae cyanobacterium CP_BM_RX_35]|nr:ATP-dependent RecD-like DNA helicase [Chroococcidiopsidaceae cyanobacterium CP_BM_RX_35]
MAATANQQRYETIQGVVERLTYHSPESGYSVARLKVSGDSDLVTIVGSFPNIQPGQTLQLTGFWKDHPKFGPQFTVTQYKETKPATITGIEKYLGSGLIKGVGPVTAKRIVAHFGLETLDIIEYQSERLIEVPGIAKKRVSMIRKAWESQRIIKEVMFFLQSHGVSTTYAVKIYKQYKDDAIAVVEKNPYQLAFDVYGIGFVTADTIARNLGVSPGSEFRYQAGIIHVLGEAGEDGHCFLPKAELVEKVVQRLALPDHQPSAQVVADTVGKMGIENQIVLQGHQEHEFICYQPSFFLSEQNLSSRLLALLSRPVTVDKARVSSWIDRYCAATGIQLSSQQRQAVEMAASERVLILTGGPGTGKTFCQRTIVALWKAMGRSIALASPTGRAAQRLAEVTGREAKTLHRLLEFDPKSMQFQRNSENPIPAQSIVVDEVSMLDLFLGYSLLKAVALDAQLLLVGDIDQLPSVGPGNVLRDLIDSGRVPVVRLTQVFRQAQTSAIVSNAHRINQGEYPVLESVSPVAQTDCLWWGAPEPQHGLQAIRELIVELLPKWGFDPARDMQLLCPMTRGEVGTRNLNTVLQQLINPPGPSKAEIVRVGVTLRLGDRIFQRKNDYNREVFNGDMGVITAIDLEEQEVAVQFAERQVCYDYADLDEITLAWAVTIHKSQGSEYPVVILPIFMQHYMMLSRNLLYTGLTRAKKLAILVGPKKALGLAVRQIKDQQRYTLLAQRLNAAAG